VKERGILFSAPMIRALLAGTKTMTRRLLNPQPVRSLPHTKPLPGGDGSWDIHRPIGWRWQKSKNFRVYVADMAEASFTENLARHCPYGVPGDRLWVRETWYDAFGRRPGEAHEMNVDRFEDGSVDGIEYRATHDCAAWEAGCQCNPDGDGKRSEWRPSIYMPRWASRLTLEVTSVRVERLQDITPEGVIAEGLGPFPRCDCEVCRMSSGMCPADAGVHLEEFAALWDSINGKRANWASNPWVWVVSFRRVAQ